MNSTDGAARTASTARTIERIWARRGPFAWALYPLSLLFHGLASLRRKLYRCSLLRTNRLPVPVVVVGNLTVGGTGKTPLVIALAQALSARGMTPGVVTRGYGGRVSGQGNGVSAVTNDDARAFGDEAVLIRQKTRAPVFVGPHRFTAGLALLRTHPQVDIVICDDGLQHYALARDVELALFDARGAGNGWLLPAGPLREPLTRLSSVDAVILNEAPALPAGSPNLPFWRMSLHGDEAWRLTDSTQRRMLTSFAGTHLLAAAGIGHPQRFFDLLAAAGLQCDTLPLPDHHDFRVNPFASSTAEIVLITEKDAVKCTHLDDPRLWVVPVRAAFEAGLIDLILEKVRGPSPA